MRTNVLYYGDNLKILRDEYLLTESVDLVYLDPPFNSNRDYNVIGIFITLEEPSRHMKEEAATAGLWHSAVWNRDFQRIQILTIRELLEEHRKPDLPAFVHAPYQRAERVDTQIAAEQAELFGEG